MIRRLIKAIRRWNADSMDRHRLESEAISRGAILAGAIHRGDLSKASLTTAERSDLAAYDDYINRGM